MNHVRPQRSGLTVRTEIDGARPAGANWLRRYALAAVMVIGLLLVPLLVIDVVGERPLSDGTLPSGSWAALVGVGLLIVDAVLPVPSSLIMVALGARFGVAVGTLLSLIGGVGGSLVAFAIGRRTRCLVARPMTYPQRRRAAELVRRYGPMAIVLTRPVPLAAETVAVVAGIGEMSWRRAVWATTIGVAVPAVTFAAVGAVARESSVGERASVAVLIVVAIATITVGSITVARTRRSRARARHAVSR